MRTIDIKKLSIDELVGVVNLYPWYGGARKELCARMNAMGGDGWGESQFADAAIYVGDREKIASMLRGSVADDWSDADMERLLKSYISEKEQSDERSESKTRTVHVIGGDYFSQADYEAVRSSDDNLFVNHVAKAGQEGSGKASGDHEVVVYTETLAQIYMEQGYPEQAKRIYSKLILAYPEKNAYFAALIAKIDSEIINQ